MAGTVVWFRRDLRISDHAPLERAARRGQVIPVFVLDPALLHHPETGSARVAFMLRCLQALDQDLQERGGRLILRYGDPVTLLPELVKSTPADGIYAYTDCERIYGRVRDARLNQALAEQGLRIRWFEPVASSAELMAYPQYRRWWFEQMREPLIATPCQIQVPDGIASQPWPDLTSLGHQPDGKGIPVGGTAAARELLQSFMATKTQRYYWQLSYPGAEATSGLSPYLKFGAISSRECVQTLDPLTRSLDARIQRSAQQLIARLRWASGFGQRFRYLPQLELRSLYTVFDQEGWDFDPKLYGAWQQGQTGFPIVDAAARCLQATGGWGSLNFRIRAIYASFLSNLLGYDWRWGALHFMRHLIDGDCPIDHYQWAMQAGVTHCVDKSWTRIYNPEQAAIDRCDPEGSFVKRWLPELAHLPPDQLGSPSPSYREPILNYRQARQCRVEQLQRQRQQFRTAADVVPHLAQLPPDLTPFGAEWVSCNVAWAQQGSLELFPTALDVQSLDPAQRQALRTWFVAHLDITPRRTPSRQKSRSKPSEPEVLQLSLLD
ncbi:MAG: deoxyribodipyrimidine photo-lyase [Synechococcaceae cyanobacterium SM2_3_2]|nr:deoxyribodipyrimidine photo-lyase [Synechococcaceae cyanobacterium SM2_3_2]